MRDLTAVKAALKGHEIELPSWAFGNSGTRFKVFGQIRSVMNVQEATAKALLIDTDALAAAQQAGDVLGANAAMMDAFSTDVRPLLGELREETGLDRDPLAAYARSGYGEKIVAERVGGTPAGWGS